VSIHYKNVNIEKVNKDRSEKNEYKQRLADPKKG
jgi:hypothetical protein